MSGDRDRRAGFGSGSFLDLLEDSATSCKVGFATSGQLSRFEVQKKHWRSQWHDAGKIVWVQCARLVPLASPVLFAALLEDSAVSCKVVLAQVLICGRFEVQKKHWRSQWHDAGKIVWVQCARLVPLALPVLFAALLEDSAISCKVVLGTSDDLESL